MDTILSTKTNISMSWVFFVATHWAMRMIKLSDSMKFDKLSFYSGKNNPALLNIVPWYHSTDPKPDPLTSPILNYTDCLFSISFQSGVSLSFVISYIALASLLRWFNSLNHEGMSLSCSHSYHFPSSCETSCSFPLIFHISFFQ